MNLVTVDVSVSLFSEEFGRHSLSLMGNVDQWVSGCKFPPAAEKLLKLCSASESNSINYLMCLN